ncbi:MAG: DUF4269 domain-containing protein [Pedobacter sp.]|nr:MAG: DUF4269 domain-containing protein [Pedobacter sp.]
MIDFEKLDYLKFGNDRQRSAYRTLTEHKIFEQLIEFSPILTGTIPINIDIAESDLDIICYCKDLNDFSIRLTNLFIEEQGFQLKEVFINDEKTVIANFYLDQFEIEIFGQNTPTKNQNSFKHMLIEHAILQKMGENFRQEIITLKQAGLKTEPAFAKLLGLSGDPYKAIMNFNV